MHQATHLPTAGEVFVDDRGDARTLRVSWHTEAGVVVLSQWRAGTCVGTFRLGVEDVPAMIALLSHGLDEAYHAARSSFLDDFGVAGDVAG
jgi:hypothetical protein